MRRSATGALALTVLSLALAMPARAQQADNPPDEGKRKPRQYDRTIRLHAAPFDAATPEDDKQIPGLKATRTSSGDAEGSEILRPAVSATVPPRAAPREAESDRKSRNWVLPPDPAGKKAEEPAEASGWGWLADEIRRREAEASAAGTQQAEADNDSAAKGQESGARQPAKGKSEYSSWDVLTPDSEWTSVSQSMAPASSGSTSADKSDASDQTAEGESSQDNSPEPAAAGYADTRSDENMKAAAGLPGRPADTRRPDDDEVFVHTKQVMAEFRTETREAGMFAAYRAELERTTSRLLGTPAAFGPASDQPSPAGPSSLPGGVTLPSFRISEPSSRAASELGSASAQPGASDGFSGMPASSFDSPGRFQSFEAAEPLKPVQPLQDLWRQDSQPAGAAEPYSAFR